MNKKVKGIEKTNEQTKPKLTNKQTKNKPLHKYGPDDLVIMYSSLDSQDAKCILKTSSSVRRTTP